jgi:hypothetical protein
MQHAHATRETEHDGAQALPPDAPVVDRRAEPRLRCNARVRVSACEGRDAGDIKTATAADCSAHGMCVILPRPVGVGGQVFVQFDHGVSRIALYTTRNCRQLESGEYRIGLVLVGFNSADRVREHPLPLLKSLLSQSSC